MAQTEMNWPVSFALFGQKQGKSKEQSALRSALSSALVSALRVALQRCSYPPHEYHQCITSFIIPLQRGHLYFAD